MNSIIGKTLKNPYRATVILFILTAVVSFLAMKANMEEFVVEQHEREVYYTITDEVTADAAIIYDIRKEKIIAGKNPTTLKSIASITKLTAGLIAVSYIGKGDITVIDARDFELTANTPLRLGDQWHTLDLLEYSLITSSNRGINAVGRTIEKKTGKSLVELMNTFVRENGLVQTHFVNPTGLDAHGTLSGSESSALDLAKIAAVIINARSHLANLTTQKKRVFYSLDNIRYDAENTNVLIGELSENILLSKTGYTDIAGGALVMVIEDDSGRHIALVVLDSGRTERFEDMRKLLKVYKGL